MRTAIAVRGIDGAKIGNPFVPQKCAAVQTVSHGARSFDFSSVGATRASFRNFSEENP
jgi:hypothetical protein